MIKTQKVIKVGNSLAVKLDKKFVQLAKIEPGQPLAVVYAPEKGLMSMAKSEQALMVKDKSEK
jgi:antitoxin component of MazEF toxin-antitoxin module